MKIKFFGIYSIHKKLLDRLPSTYPQSKLIIHSSIAELNKYYWSDGDKDDDEYPNDLGYYPFAYCNGDDNLIHVPTQLNRESLKLILWILLHEMGHLYAYQRYGKRNRRWTNYKESERYADQFAYRWVRKLKREGWF